jgi:hypothetical protein
MERIQHTAMLLGELQAFAATHGIDRRAGGMT